MRQHPIDQHSQYKGFHKEKRVREGQKTYLKKSWPKKFHNKGNTFKYRNPREFQIR